MSRVCIIGMGWLGLQLAQRLKAESYEVLGTVSSKEKLDHIKADFESVFVFNLNDYQDDELLQFNKVDYFILTIPPSASANYAENMKRMITKLLNSAPTAKLIYTSSSSVYGSKPRTVTEDSETLPETNNAKEIVKIEQHLIHQFESRSSILRLGGLVGKNRHPIKYLSGRSSLKKGKAPVNLVHADDICDLILQLLENEQNSGIFNLCCTDHPTKETYYTWAAKQFQLPLPKFNTFDNQLDKIVSSDAIKKINFEMNYKSPYDFPIAT